MIFARGKQRYNMANFFAEYTDVWEFGTADDYRAFADHLRRHAAGHADHTSIPPDRSSPGMDVLLLPTCVDATPPFLVIQERMIRQKKRTNMELIIGGTSEGFAYLEYQFLEIIQNAEGDPSDHIHVDLNTELLEFPTVFLNIRGPRECGPRSASIHTGTSASYPEAHIECQSLR